MEEKPHILLLDDQKILLGSLARCLSLAGYEAFMASTEEEALQVTQQVNLDVLLFDIELEDTTGFEVYSKICALKSFASPPVIFMSGNKSQEYRQAAKEIEGAAFLMKPFTPSEVKLLIENKLGASKESQGEEKEIKT